MLDLQIARTYLAATGPEVAHHAGGAVTVWRREMAHWPDLPNRIVCENP
jgi:hypothetical protein